MSTSFRGLTRFVKEQTSGHQYLIRHFGHFPALPSVNPPWGPVAGMGGTVDVAPGLAPQGPMPLVLNYVTLSSQARRNNWQS